MFAAIEDTFFNQYSWTYPALSSNYLADILLWMAAIRNRKRMDAKQQLISMEMLIHAIHSQEPGKLAETIRTAIHEIDDLGNEKKEDDDAYVAKSVPKVEGYYPDEEVGLEGLDKIRNIREGYGMQ